MGGPRRRPWRNPNQDHYFSNHLHRSSQCRANIHGNLHRNAGTLGTHTFVQVNSSTPQTDQSTVTTAFANAQTIGNLNVVVIGWDNTTSNIVSVTDTAGNSYQVAAPITRSSGNSQTFYYARNIVGGAITR